ncbi:hypothetical protein NDU88_003741 [Pleurodeles waltl]|uniref:Uncharacterized protein n=1 Tax=Pleurodeles waltl TaxID=8319 RepID=A0AAV7V3A0_PLEWA|nr:hypothetical protein NDU88_003741 [Pleurodeles waltl]
MPGPLPPSLAGSPCAPRRPPHRLGRVAFLRARACFDLPGQRELRPCAREEPEVSARGAGPGLAGASRDHAGAGVFKLRQQRRNYLVSYRTSDATNLYQEQGRGTYFVDPGRINSARWPCPY